MATITFSMEASHEEILAATVVALKSAAHAHYMAAQLHWMVLKRDDARLWTKDGEMPPDIHNSFVRTAYKEVLNTLPEGSPFRPVLAQFMEADLQPEG